MSDDLKTFTNKMANAMLDSITVKAEKLAIHLVPPDVMESLAKVLQFGAKKHGVRNWEKEPMDWSLAYGAAMRHLLAFWGGEDADPETGYEHVEHALCEVVFLVAYVMRGIGKDDRGPRWRTVTE